MDTEHRHELKTNELADWIAHLPEFAKQNASTIIGVVLIIVAFITWPMFTRMRQASEIAKSAEVTESIQNLERDIYAVIQAADKDEAARLQASSALIVSANALLEQAGKIENPELSALARIKAAQALRTELAVRTGTVSDEEVQTRITQAQEVYQKALDLAAEPTTRAMAKLGLGLCAEELGQRDAAAAIYQDIIDTQEFAPTVFPMQAQQRLDGLKENFETFTFAPAPVEPQIPGVPEAVKNALSAPAAPAPAEAPVVDVKPAVEATPSADAQASPAEEAAQ